jgi:hypothetical protein
MLTQRQRLRAIVDRNADLFDPPNTAKAFARLEAALDEVKNHSSADSDITGQNDLLDPPNTAERFARIEAALDAVFSKPTSAAPTQGHRKKSKFGTRLPLQHFGSRSTQALQSLKMQPPRSATLGALTRPHAQTSSDHKGRCYDTRQQTRVATRLGHIPKQRFHPRVCRKRISEREREVLVIAIANGTQKLYGFGILGEHVGHNDDFAPGRLEKQVLS